MQGNSEAGPSEPAVAVKSKAGKINGDFIAKKNKHRDDLEKLLANRPKGFDLPPDKPGYYEQEGLRKIEPYTFAFHAYAKERWYNRKLVEVFGEFRDRSMDYYTWAIESGQILVNGQKTSPDYIIRNGDMLSNIMHRHEPPVVAGKIKIVYDGRLPGNDGKTFVIEKPGSMPVHPTGRYNFNTMLNILKYDYELPLIHTVNRLDRLTSGVMVCSLTAEYSKELSGFFQGTRLDGDVVQKEYVARVLGRFPDEEVVCDQPLLTIDRQLGVNVVHPDGRPAKTIFKAMRYHEKSNTTLVHCKPITGRSHQIRVHLQFLGFPIANDPVYQNSEAWGPTGGRGGVFGHDCRNGALGEMRGGGPGMRALRRELADKFMALKKEEEEQQQLSESSGPEGNDDEVSRPETPVSSADGQDSNVTELSRTLSEALIEEGTNVGPTDDAQVKTRQQIRAQRKAAKEASIYNKYGRLKVPKKSKRAAAPNDEEQGQDGETKRGTDSYDPLDPDNGRHSSDPPLTDAARQALRTLRSKKDERENWSIERDRKGIELAQHGVGASDDGTSPTAHDDEEDEEQDAAGFCQVCFTPLVPDPRPDQLYIWLHAMRYYTRQWDWKSEGPDWAREDWDGQVPDFAKEAI